MEKSKKITTIETSIKNKGLLWQAAENPVSKLSAQEQKRRLGLQVNEADIKRIQSALLKATIPATFSKSRDWRETNGEDWTTSIRDQGSCGSCVAFGTLATIECQAKIQFDKPKWNIDLSEADLFFCGAGKKCDEGWWPTYALDYVKNKGVPDEDCFPYKDENMECKTCSDRSKRIVKIGSWEEIIDLNKRKEWLDKKGPLVACMAVYDDFFYYKNGVYKPTTDELAGYHAICCVGYDEKEKCWICKNSWGDDWGDKGFFKIAYGVSDIDTKFAMYGVENLTTPEEDQETGDWADYVGIEKSFTDNRLVVWARVNGEMKYQILTSTNPALDQLLEASAVNITYKNDQITKLSVWKKI